MKHVHPDPRTPVQYRSWLGKQFRTINRCLDGVCPHPWVASNSNAMRMDNLFLKVPDSETSGTNFPCTEISYPVPQVHAACRLRV